MCDPILFTPLKMQPHYSQSSRENATPSSGTSPLASYNEVPPLPPGPPVPIPGTLRTSSYFTDSSVFVPTRKAIRKIINTYPICQSPLKRSARRGAALLRTVTEIAPKSSFYVWTEAVSNNNTTSPTSLRSKRFQSSYCAKGRAGAKSKWKGEGEGEKETFSPLPSPVIPFFRVRTGHGKPTTTTKLY